MTHEELSVTLTREEIEILMYALFQSMKARQKDMQDGQDERAEDHYLEIKQLEELNKKLGAVLYNT